VVLTMGDKIVVMQNGWVQQEGSPLDLYNRPVNIFVAGFIGSPGMNFIPVTVSEENATVYVQNHGLKISLPPEMGAKTKASEVKDFIFGVRPEDITKKGTGEATVTMSESVPARVNVIETLGKETYLDITIGDVDITAIVSPNIPVELNEALELEINMDKVHLFSKDDGQAIF